ncbi:MAG: RraA family protein [Methanobacterium sp.]|nr:RraA family protein [Methanobacterium sp.]
MVRKMEISAESLLEHFSSKKLRDTINFQVGNLDITTSQISDALKNLTGESGVIPGVKPIKDHLRINGRVVTVQTQQDDWGTSLKAVETAKKGEIVVICCDGDDIAVWGELFSKYAQKKGVQSTVIYGAMRDVEAVQELNYPVFSRSVVPNAGTPRAEGEINISIECGGIEIKPGDWVFGDDCGVLVVAEEILEKVIHEAIQIKKNEDIILHQLEEGISLSNILGI